MNVSMMAAALEPYEITRMPTFSILNTPFIG
jgi:hypothetical protein